MAKSKEPVSFEEEREFLGIRYSDGGEYHLYVAVIVSPKVGYKDVPLVATPAENSDNAKESIDSTHRG